MGILHGFVVQLEIVPCEPWNTSSIFELYITTNMSQRVPLTILNWTRTKPVVVVLLLLVPYYIPASVV
jgi:hypothetical protein